MSLSEIRAPIHKNRNTTMGRISNFYSTGTLFKDINLTKHIYGETQNSSSLAHFPIPQQSGEHGGWMEYTKPEIIQQNFVPVVLPSTLGPTWSTHWFKVTFTPPPATWNGNEIHLRFASGTEACVYEEVAGDLHVLQGISPGFREEYIVTQSYNNATPPLLSFYIEMACNGMFGVGQGNDIGPTDNNRTFTLTRVDLAVFNREHFNLLVDMEQLHGMADQLSNSHIGYQAMFVANQIVTIFSDEGDVAKARQLATEFFSEGVGSKAHVLHAMGHCHIDSAWLWPYDETVRKCARSFSAQMKLMDEYPDYKFVCSSAQQYAWVQKWYPDLFTKIKEKVTSGQFVPVGGTWVEMDGNLPNGEAFMRQYYYGQKFFEQEFGKEFISKEFWLPDTFGYSAQIPQMLKHVKIDRFLTQKMSWSLVNKFPNHNFWWEGIDGTQVLVHFPPGDSYNMSGSVNEFLNSQNNSLDKGRSNTGVYLYGWGDGGGGPTRQMIERIKRVQNVDGMPKVVFSDSNTFFDALATESNKFYRWVGELYLELHNGTYTSQAKIKWFNRKGEFLFREVELLMAMAYTSATFSPTYINADMTKVDDCWKDFLLNQFHDVLPGSCIEAVAKDAWKIYEDLFAKLMEIRTRYNGAILGGGNTTKAVFNCLPWEVQSVLFMKPDAGNPPSGDNIQNVTLSSEPFENETEGMFRVPSTFSAALTTLNPSGYTVFAAQAPAIPVSFTAGTAPQLGTFANGKITLEVEIVDGKPVERLFFDGENKVPVFNDYLNIGINPGMLYYYDDIPLFWDAWDVMDYHLETRREPDLLEPEAVETFATGPIVGGYKWGAKFGNGSSFTRYTIMRADSPMLEYYTIVDWKEDHKMLKAEFPMDVLSREATYEIQYGHASRPTHINTSWDMAKFEVCGHKWMDISQSSHGVTVITDSKYGWHVRDNHVQLSLLKSPKNPDANCDMHKHYIYYAVLPHKGPFQSEGVIQKAYNLNTLGSNNVPLLNTNLPETSMPARFVTCSNPAVVVAAVKVSKPQDVLENTICVRLYEAYGGYADTGITVNGFTIAKVFETNGLEDPSEDELPVTSNTFNVRFKPFQIRSFLITFD